MLNSFANCDQETWTANWAVDQKLFLTIAIKIKNLNNIMQIFNLPMPLQKAAPESSSPPAPAMLPIMSTSPPLALRRELHNITWPRDPTGDIVPNPTQTEV